MSGAPELLSGTPEAAGRRRCAGVDALSDILAAVRLYGGVFLDAQFTAPWCISAQVGPDDCQPLGRIPAHIIAYHYVVAGRLFIQAGDGPPEEAVEGDIVLLPRNDPHALSSAPGLRPVVIDHLIRPPDGDAPATLRHGGGGAVTQIVCGFLGCDVPDNPLLATLPGVLHVNVHDAPGGDWIGGSFRRAADEFSRGGIGSATVLGKLAELLFVEAVRRYLATLPEGSTGWLAGLRDRAVGRALAVLHGRLAEDWTTEALAREVGLSRSAFAERFTALIGMPPMRYLARWRLQLAAVRLRDSARPSAQIAYDVGYESEAAFSRAFKRSFGMTPAAWRRRG
jgi:AraC-like DNA-binding protein